MLPVQVISSLPYPFSLFQQLCLEFAFFRIHGALLFREKSYVFSLFRFFPSGRLYCQQWIKGVNVEKLLSYLNVSPDFIRPFDADGAYGSLYLQVPLSKLSLVLE
ncbi:hypothetical protein ACFPQ1_25145 [Rhodocytophaga aerolata]|uniref:hypothetical protein n=1 Tax=Rhodocytophaga aerolata TaxID=455078 RepID=UPI00361F94AC